MLICTHRCRGALEHFGFQPSQTLFFPVQQELFSTFFFLPGRFQSEFPVLLTSCCVWGSRGPFPKQTSGAHGAPLLGEPFPCCTQSPGAGLGSARMGEFQSLPGCSWLHPGHGSSLSHSRAELSGRADGGSSALTPSMPGMSPHEAQAAFPG